MDNNEQTNNKRSNKEEVLIFNKNKRMKNNTNILKQPLDKVKQLTVIEKIRTKNEGPKYMLISKNWYLQWEAYCFGLNAAIPNSIDNSDLLDENGNIKEDLVLDKDYLEIPLNAWLYFEQWYGVKDELHRLSKDKELNFKLYVIGKPIKTNHSFSILPNSTVLDFQTKLLKTLGTNHVELWLLNTQNNFFLERINSNPNFIISSSLLNQGDRYAIKIDPTTISVHSTILTCLSAMSSISTFKNHYLLAVNFNLPIVKKPISLCGLQNLGNSCYLNSAIQCLSNTPQLTHYFLSEKYKEDINRSSRLGLKGNLAEAYALLLRNMWKANPSTSRHSISPKEFKNTLEEFNKQFAGYQQHDSQELLSSLLDGLHEDLNKVLRKPYIESSSDDDEEDVPDIEIANQSWKYHKSRDDSFIVDLFQGQYKSRLICNVCKKVSVTFDTFMYLSLPLPIQPLEINVVYVPYLPSQKQLAMTVQLNKDAKIKNFVQQVGDNSKYSLLVVKIKDEKIAKIFQNEDSVSLIHAQDIIYVYQVPNIDEHFIVPVYCSTTIKGDSITQFGYPILLAIEKSSIDKIDLYSEIVYHIERYCIVKLFEEDQTKAQAPKKEIQYPIHTTAAVTPAGGRPMIPMNHLFNIRLFETDQMSLYPIEFPLLDDTNKSFNWVHDSQLKQGQGIVIEWSISKAQQIFGTSSAGINTEAWFDYDDRRKHSKRLVTLDDCLDEYTKEEQLSGQDAWFCSRCKQLQCASKKIDIWKLPEVMVIHLKRFSQIRRWGNKVDMFVDFPLTELDMTDRVLLQPKQKLIYDLYAVDNHYGGLHGGHYTAFAKNIENLNWYEFDDTRVNGINPEDIKTNAAYLLFYKKRK